MISEMEIEFPTDEVLHSGFPLHRACRDGDISALYSLLHCTVNRSDLIAEDTCYGWTPIHWAARYGKLECVVHLVRVGCDVNAATTRLAQTPIHSATFGDHPECVQWLLRAGADTDRQDYVGESAIHKAARSGSTDCVRTLLIHGAKPDLRNMTGLTAADLAQSQGFWECFQLLSNAQNHLVQLSHSLTVSPLTNDCVPRGGNRKRLIDELENICIKKARTDSEQSTEENQLSFGLANRKSPEETTQHHDADMCGSLHRAGSPGVCVTQSQMSSDLGDLLHYGHYHGFGDTAEDIAAIGAQQLPLV